MEWMLGMQVCHTMGRYYGGDIAGKFWFGIQNSADARHFGVEPTDPQLIYSSCGDECPPAIALGDVCPECSSDEECEAVEQNEIQFQFGAEHIETVRTALNNVTNQLLQMTPRFAEVLQKVEEDQAWRTEGYSDDNWVEFSVDLVITDIANSLPDNNEYSVLAARFFLGTQILRCLLVKGSCYFWCEL